MCMCIGTYSTYSVIRVYEINANKIRFVTAGERERNDDEIGKSTNGKNVQYIRRIEK